MVSPPTTLLRTNSSSATLTSGETSPLLLSPSQLTSNMNTSMSLGKKMKLMDDHGFVSISNSPPKALSHSEKEHSHKSPAGAFFSGLLSPDAERLFQQYRAPIIISLWIFFSSCTILYNKYVLSTLNFRFPIYLTTVHLLFATVMTRILKSHTNLLQGVDRNPMSWRQWWSGIVPVGLLFTGTLICSNRAYLYLSVSFIQMLKATTPLLVLLFSFALGTQKLSMQLLAVVSVIVSGIIISSYGEILFDMTGFSYQMVGIVFEAARLVMIERLVNSKEGKMDPLCSLYYFAPVCAFFNAILCLALEYSTIISTGAVHKIGIFILLTNASTAFLLNVSLVFLIGATSSLVLTLAGILKDLLLVGASVAIFGNPVSGLQLMGYSLTLCGLAKYKTMSLDWTVMAREWWLKARKMGPKENMV